MKYLPCSARETLIFQLSPRVPLFCSYQILTSSVIYDQLLLNRRTVTWNLFVNYCRYVYPLTFYHYPRIFLGKSILGCWRNKSGICKKLCDRRVLKGGGVGGRRSGGGLNRISQPFFRPNPSPSIEIAKKSQGRLFTVTSSFKTQFCVSLLFLELVFPSIRYKCLLFAWYVALSTVLWFVLDVFSCLSL